MSARASRALSRTRLLAPHVRRGVACTVRHGSDASGSHSCGKGHGHSHGSHPPSAPSLGETAQKGTLREFVRKGDYEGYLVGLFMPSAARDAYFALRALNIEVATIRDSTRGNATAAHIRMAFWRDMVEAAYSGGHHAHPLFPHIAAAVTRHGWTRRWLDRLIDARDEDVDGKPPGTLGDLESYAERTSGSLLYLSLEACGVAEEASDTAASHVGRAVGLATVLRALPVHGRMGQRYVPSEVMDSHGLTERDLVIVPDKDIAASDGTRLADIARAMGGGDPDDHDGPGSVAGGGGGVTRGSLGSEAARIASGGPVDAAQREADREALRQAALRRLAGSVSAARSGGTLSDLTGGTIPPPPLDGPEAARAFLEGGGGARNVPGDADSKGREHIDEEEPRTLRLAGSRATGAGAGGGASRAGGGPRVFTATPDGTTTASHASSSSTSSYSSPAGGLYDGRGVSGSGSVGGINRTIVVGGPSSRSSSSRGSSVGASDGGTAAELGMGAAAAAAGGMFSTGDRLAAIAEARARQSQQQQQSASPSSAPATSSSGAPGGIRIETAPAPLASSRPVPSSGTVNTSTSDGGSSSAAASSAEEGGSLLSSLFGGRPPGPRLVLTKDAHTQAQIRAAVGDIARVAAGHLAAARALRGSLPPEAMPALLPAVPTDRFLRRLEAQGYDVFAAGPLGPWRDTRSLARLYLQLDLLRHTLRGSF